MAAVAAATIGTIGTVHAAREGRKAARRASRDQRRASDANIAFAEESRDLAREDLAPFREAGLNALAELQGLTFNPNALNNDLFSALNRRSLPAIEEARVGQGLGRSRGTVDAISDRLFDNFMIAGPNLEQQRFNNRFNVLSPILSQGQASAAGEANSALGILPTVSNANTNAGIAQSNAQINQANATTNALNNIAGIFGALPSFSFSRGGDFSGAVRPISSGGNALAGPFQANGRF